MIASPEVQRAELDAVGVRARLFTFADAPHLPYVRAITKGIPRCATEDDWFVGVFKGASCVVNI
jgi:hypothetical protein